MPPGQKQQPDRVISAPSAQFDNLPSLILSHRARMDAQEEAFSVGETLEGVIAHLKAKRSDERELPNGAVTTPYFQEPVDSFYPQTDRYLRIRKVEENLRHALSKAGPSANDNQSASDIAEAKAKLVRAYQAIDPRIAQTDAERSAALIADQCLHPKVAASR